MEQRKPKPENLQPWTDYARGKPLLFPTPAVTRHFLITRKAKMLELGILFESSRGWIVDAAGLDDALLELLCGPEKYHLTGDDAQK